MKSMINRFISMLVIVMVMLFMSACGNSQEKFQEQYNLGIRYLSEGNYEEAILAFNAAIEIDSKNAEIYLARATAYIGVDDEEAALLDIEKALQTADEPKKLAEQVMTFSDYVSDTESFIKILEEYLPKDMIREYKDKTTSKEAMKNAEKGLEDILLSYKSKQVSNEPFTSASYNEDNPWMLLTHDISSVSSGFVSGCLKDIDCDGYRELVSVWSDGKSLYLHETDVSTDGSYADLPSYKLTDIDPATRVKIILYHRKGTTQWLIAVDEYRDSYIEDGIGLDSNTNFVNILYEFTSGGLKQILYQCNNMIISPYASINRMAVQWPLGEDGMIRTDNLDDITWMSDLECSCSPDYTYTMCFKTMEELEALSVPDNNILGENSLPSIAPSEFIGKPLSDLTAVMGLDFVRCYSDSGYDYTYKDQSFIFDGNGIIVDTYKNEDGRQSIIKDLSEYMGTDLWNFLERIGQIQNIYAGHSQDQSVSYYTKDDSVWIDVSDIIHDQLVTRIEVAKNSRYTIEGIQCGMNIDDVLNNGFAWEQNGEIFWYSQDNGYGPGDSSNDQSFFCKKDDFKICIHVSGDGVVDIISIDSMQY